SRESVPAIRWAMAWSRRKCCPRCFFARTLDLTLSPSVGLVGRCGLVCFFLDTGSVFGISYVLCRCPCASPVFVVLGDLLADHFQFGAEGHELFGKMLVGRPPEALGILPVISLQGRSVLDGVLHRVGDAP